MTPPPLERPIASATSSLVNAAPTNTPPSHRYDYIDALRGFACLWVVLHHSLDSIDLSPYHNVLMTALTTFAGIGSIGVHLFLVLSGFCLYFPLVRRWGVDKAQVDLKEFAKRRAMRILPPYYIALAIFGTLKFLHDRHNAQHTANAAPHAGPALDMGLHALMLHNFVPATIMSINAPFWSLALESQLYIIFPLLVIMASRWGIKSILAATMGVSIVAQSTSLMWLTGHNIPVGPDPNLATVLFRSLPCRCFEFAAGMSAAAIVAGHVRFSTRWVVALALAIGIPDCWWIANRGLYGILIDQTLGITFACLVVAASSIPAAKFEGGILKFFTWLGMFSYSLYLIHFPLLRIHPFVGSPAKLAILALVRIALLIPIAYAFFLVAEKPFLTKRRSPTNAELERAVALSPAP